MASTNSIHANPWLSRRFWRLFRREKPPRIHLSYSYHYMMRFPRLPITVPPLVPTLMSYRWNDDDDYNITPKKLFRQKYPYQQQLPVRRRFSKRYSDIVGPLSSKVYLPRKDFTIREKQMVVPLSPQKQYHPSFKRNNHESIYMINKKSMGMGSSSFKPKKTTEPSIITRRYGSKTKQSTTRNAEDLLAHRMQAAMSTELMHSLDRNFILAEKKSAMNMNRSHSFHISTQPSNNWWETSLPKSYYPQIIPRVKQTFDHESPSVSFEEPTPDYEDAIIIRSIQNDEIGEEPIADYDDPNSIPISELEETTPTSSELAVSSSCIAPQTSLTSSSASITRDPSSIPPTPPPLPNEIIEQKKMTFRCRTIAEKITPSHQLILKDQLETKVHPIEDKQSDTSLSSSPSIHRSSPLKDRSKTFHRNPTIPPKPCHLHLSKEVLEKTTLRKVSHPVSRSYSTYGSMSQFNDQTTESNTLTQKMLIIDEQPLDGLSSSATTSIVIENEYEHRTSSKIYNDYKRRASLITVPTNNTFDGTSSQSTMTHPMHTHIGLRSSTSSSSNNDKPNEIILSNKQMNVCVINQLNQHLTTRFRKQQQQQQQQQQQEIAFEKTSESPPSEEKSNVYDEPQTAEMMIKCPVLLPPSVPPPPPPLPIGGFRSIQTQFTRPVSSQRTSAMTLPRDTNSTGTSTTSSKLSDTRILRELRTNPLFAKAKQHLEIESEPTNSYFKLDSCSPTINHRESFLIRSDELNPIINEKSKNISLKCRQSELELIFQKRVQRNEQNLT